MPNNQRALEDLVSALVLSGHVERREFVLWVGEVRSWSHRIECLVDVCELLLDVFLEG